MYTFKPNCVCFLRYLKIIKSFFRKTTKAFWSKLSEKLKKFSRPNDCRVIDENKIFGVFLKALDSLDPLNLSCNYRVSQIICFEKIAFFKGWVFFFRFWFGGEVPKFSIFTNKTKPRWIPSRVRFSKTKFTH